MEPSAHSTRYSVCCRCEVALYHGVVGNDHANLTVQAEETSAGGNEHAVEECVLCLCCDIPEKVLRES